MAATNPRQTVVFFTLAGHNCAFRLEEVQEVVPLPTLARPPGMPAGVEGFLDLGGVAVPVIRLDRLFGLPEQELGLYTPLLVLGGPSDPFAVPVDAVRGIHELASEPCVPLADNQSFNNCMVGEIDSGGRRNHLLSAERILTLEERRRLAELRAMAEQRLQLLEPRS